MGSKREKDKRDRILKLKFNLYGEGRAGLLKTRVVGIF